MTSATAAAPRTRPVSIPVSETLPWLIGSLVVGLLVFYFIGIDEGATSVFGNSTVVHDLLHDARHMLGFPCH